MLAQGLADIISGGGYGAIGGHGQHYGLRSHWELWMDASAISSMAALEIAANHGDHFLGMEEALGSLRAGELADLLMRTIYATP